MLCKKIQLIEIFYYPGTRRVVRKLPASLLQAEIRA